MHNQVSEEGLTVETDMEDLRCLNYLTLEFSDAEGTDLFKSIKASASLMACLGKTTFLREARFHGLQENSTISPFSSPSYSMS